MTKPNTYPCTQCILDFMNSSGPQTKGDLRRECQTQAVPYSTELFEQALIDLCGSETIVAEVLGEDTKPFVYFDFPASYYEPKRTYPQLLRDAFDARALACHLTNTTMQD